MSWTRDYFPAVRVRQTIMDVRNLTWNVFDRSGTLATCQDEASAQRIADALNAAEPDAPARNQMVAVDGKVFMRDSRLTWADADGNLLTFETGARMASVVAVHELRWRALRAALREYHEGRELGAYSALVAELDGTFADTDALGLAR